MNENDDTGGNASIVWDFQLLRWRRLYGLDRSVGLHDCLQNGSHALEIAFTDIWKRPKLVIN